jgi:hypothetical protein
MVLNQLKLLQAYYEEQKLSLNFLFNNFLIFKLWAMVKFNFTIGVQITKQILI